MASKNPTFYFRFRFGRVPIYSYVTSSMIKFGIRHGIKFNLFYVQTKPKFWFSENNCDRYLTHNFPYILYASN